MRPNEALIRELEAQLGRRDRRQLRLRSPRRLRGTGAGPWGADAAASARLATSRTVHRVLTLLMHVSPDVRDPDRVLAARAGDRNQFAPLECPGGVLPGLRRRRALGGRAQPLEHGLLAVFSFQSTVPNSPDAV